MIPPFVEIDWEGIFSLPISDDSPRLHALPQNDTWLNQPVYHAMKATGSISTCYLRLEVIERLRHAAQFVYEAGFRLTILDGWRPPKVQQSLYHDLYSSIQQKLPQESEHEWHHQTQFFVSWPSEDKLCPSPHLTGGAVDVTLSDMAGNRLDMGSTFDDPTPKAYVDAYETIPGDIREHRRILYQAMHQAGFTSLPTEWWHFDYGNQNWAFFNGQTKAKFGLAYPDDWQ